jgi:deoxycytidylate deaminase
MNDIELAEKIIDQKGVCKGIYCNTCPIKTGCDAIIDANPDVSDIHYSFPSPAHVELAESYLLEKKYVDEH